MLGYEKYDVAWRNSGEKAMSAFVEKWKSTYPKLEIWAERAENVLAFYDFPKPRRGSYTRTTA